MLRWAAHLSMRKVAAVRQHRALPCVVYRWYYATYHPLSADFHPPGEPTNQLAEAGDPTAQV